MIYKITFDTGRIDWCTARSKGLQRTNGNKKGAIFSNDPSRVDDGSIIELYSSVNATYKLITYFKVAN